MPVALKNDNRAILGATAHAQRAADFIHKFSARDTVTDADAPAAA